MTLNDRRNRKLCPVRTLCGFSRSKFVYPELKSGISRYYKEKEKEKNNFRQYRSLGTKQKEPRCEFQIWLTQLVISQALNYEQ